MYSVHDTWYSKMSIIYSEEFRHEIWLKYIGGNPKLNVKRILAKIEFPILIT